MSIRVNDFACNDCGVISDILWKTESPEDTSCPQCGSKNLTKHIGSPRIVGGVGGGLYAKTPQGFKDIIKETMRVVPEHAKGIGTTAI